MGDRELLISVQEIAAKTAAFEDLARSHQIISENAEALTGIKRTLENLYEILKKPELKKTPVNVINIETCYFCKFFLEDVAFFDLSLREAPLRFVLEIDLQSNKHLTFSGGAGVLGIVTAITYRGPNSADMVGKTYKTIGEEMTKAGMGITYNCYNFCDVNCQGNVQMENGKVLNYFRMLGYGGTPVDTETPAYKIMKRAEAGIAEFKNAQNE